MLDPGPPSPTMEGEKEMKKSFFIKNAFCLLLSCFCLALLLPACGTSSSKSSILGNICSPTQSENVTVNGTWLFSGTGHRGGCLDEDSNGVFHISSISIPISQSDGVIQDTLGNMEFSLTGTVNGECVIFSATETSAGVTTSMDFEGTYSNGKIEGAFEGEDSVLEQCEITRGSFRVNIQ